MQVTRNEPVYSKRKQVPGESVSRNSYQMQSKVGQAIKTRNGKTETKKGKTKPEATANASSAAQGCS